MRRGRYQIALVHWLDAFYCEEHEKGSPGHPQLSVGILLENRKTHVKLAQTIDAQDGPSPEPRDVLTIPRGMVQSLQIVHRESRR